MHAIDPGAFCRNDAQPGDAATQQPKPDGRKKAQEAYVRPAEDFRAPIGASRHCFALRFFAPFCGPLVGENSLACVEKGRDGSPSRPQDRWESRSENRKPQSRGASLPAGGLFRRTLSRNQAEENLGWTRMDTDTEARTSHRWKSETPPNGDRQESARTGTTCSEHPCLFVSIRGSNESSRLRSSRFSFPP